MHYTLLMTEEVQGNQTLQLDKNGNQYTVGIYNKDTKEYKHITYDTISEARDKYMEMCCLMIECIGSWKGRVNVFFMGTEE